MKRRLLIQSCSQRKRHLNGLAPAIEVYDGPAFRVLRRYFRLHSGESELEVRILSARFGLIAAFKQIPFYDERMTLERAISLNSEVCGQLRALVWKEPFHQVLVNLGADYMPAVADGLAEVPSSTELMVAIGSIGMRLRILKKWLDRS